jgi:hypothetical protein
MKKISSAKRIYHSIVPLNKTDENFIAFPVYRDDDIGIKEGWRLHIIDQVYFYNFRKWIMI